jgi:GTP cyclohydrolase I
MCTSATSPAGRDLGLPNFARLVEIFARRLQTQETMTAKVTQSLDRLRPLGVAVMIEAEQVCMAMRVGKQGAVTSDHDLKG